MNKVKINMLSKADKVPGQGVGSAYIEQTTLVKSSDKLDIAINSPKGDFDIYHIHSVHFHNYLRMNKKHINIVHVHFVPSMNDGSIWLPFKLVKILYWYINKMYKKADELIVVNPNFIKPVMDIGINEDKITYIPNFVSRERFHPLKGKEIYEAKAKYDIPNNKFIVLGCGQIQTRKGFDDFVETARRISDAYFIWCGGFSFGGITDGYRKYKNMIKKHLPKNMRVLGIISRNSMNEIYNLADLLFMPSYLELFPMAILEACNTKTPLLLRDVDIYKPILFDKYASAKNVDGFVEEISRMKSDKDYYTTLVSKSEDISSYYNKEKMLKEWEDYYQNIFSKYHKAN